MKSICRYLKLRKLKSGVAKESWEKLEGKEFLVVFFDGTTEWCIDKDELYTCLSKDHIKQIHYIFDMTDRIAVERSVMINTEEI